MFPYLPEGDETCHITLQVLALSDRALTWMGCQGNLSQLRGGRRNNNLIQILTRATHHPLSNLYNILIIHMTIRIPEKLISSPAFHITEINPLPHPPLTCLHHTSYPYLKPYPSPCQYQFNPLAPFYNPFLSIIPRIPINKNKVTIPQLTLLNELSSHHILAERGRAE